MASGKPSVDDPLATPRLSRAEYAEITAFARSHFGLDLRSGKEELVMARLSKKLREGKFASFSEYFAHAQSDRTGQALTALVDALTTNHTSFHREAAHFELLQKLATSEFANVPMLRVWSAACSTGEEPYTIAACLTAGARRAPARWEIRGTDISTRVLEKAKRGVYPESSLASLPPGWLTTCFQQGRGASAGLCRPRPEIAARVRFGRLNLIEGTGDESGWHVIFCRNVMIYFDKPTQQRVVERLAACLEPGGYLMIGHSESLNGIAGTLEYVQPATYRRTSDHTTRRLR